MFKDGLNFTMTEARNLISKLPSIDMLNLIQSLIFVILGFIFAKLISGFLANFLARHTSAHHSMLLRRFTYYIVLIIFLLVAFAELGFEVNTLLGGVGVLTVAIGFAARTPISNLISGFFLIGEKPFIIGDQIKIGDLTGEIITINLLSIKLRTFDNTLVRIPNETLVTNQFENLTKCKVRRLVIPIKITFEEDIDKLKKILLKLAKENPLILESPNPLLDISEFIESAIKLSFKVWVKQASYDELKANIYFEIVKALNANKIKINLPTQNLQLLSTNLTDNTTNLT